MSRNTLESLQGEKYQTLVRQQFADARLLLVSDNGESLWDGDEDATLATACQKALKFLAANTDSENPLSASTEGKVAFQALPLRSLQDEFIAWVCICHCPPDTGLQLVENIFAMIRDEYLLLCELDDMARELSERYDELNLVYDTDEYAATQNVVEKALVRLVRNCVDYLDIDVARLNLPDKNISLTSAKKGSAHMASGSLRNAAEELLDWMQDNHTSLVMNEASEMEMLRTPVDYRLMAAPVLSARENIDGILTVVRSQDGLDFTNSDRNLLEVMSRRVSQLLQGSYDLLTGVFNRWGYEQQIDQNVVKGAETNLEHCILNIDIDDLHVVNDSLGFQVGDDVIRKAGSLIRELIRDNDVLARIGSNEFGVVLYKCPLEYGEKIAEKIRQEIFFHNFGWEGLPLKISASIGLVVANADSGNAAELISNAELACEAAKERGKNQVYSFGNNIHDLTERRDQVNWVGRINEALEQGRFQLYAQQIKSIEHVPNDVHCEILLRLKDEDGKILSPFAFIPAAERYRLMPEIDRWVLSNTLKTLAAKRSELEGRPVTISINLSGQSLGQAGFADFVLECIEESGVPLEWLCLEVTESAAIDNVSLAHEFMLNMRERGIRFSLDDFGTGLSSFQYLKSLPVHYLKIDGYFIREITSDPVSKAIVTSIHQVAESMNLRTVAEFVENEEILALLEGIGVTYAQGYGIGKPIPVADFLRETLTDEAGLGDAENGE